MDIQNNMKHLYFFRHGETELNKEGRFQGQSNNPPLNEEGRKQAYVLSQDFSQIPLDIIYSSPLQRAIQTAQQISSNKDIRIVIDNRLIEGNFGIAEGQLKEYLQKNITDSYNKWRDLKNMDFAFPQGESKREIVNRVQKFLNDLNSVPYEHIGISTHSAVIRCLLLSLGIFQDKIPNAKIIHIISKDGNFSYVND